MDSEGTLRIKDVEKKDKGIYTCMGSNSLGSAKTDSYLLVKGNWLLFSIIRKILAWSNLIKLLTMRTIRDFKQRER